MNANEQLMIILLQLLLAIRLYWVSTYKKVSSNTFDSLFAMRLLSNTEYSEFKDSISFFILVSLCLHKTWQLYHSPLLTACSFSTVLEWTVCEWFLAQLGHIWLHQLNRFHCFRHSCLLKTSEPTLPNNLETPKLSRSFTSRAAGTATTWASHRKAEENIFNWHHCRDNQHLSHLTYQTT